MHSLSDVLCYLQDQPIPDELEVNKSVCLWTKCTSPLCTQGLHHFTDTARGNLQIFVATYFCGLSATAN